MAEQSNQGANVYTVLIVVALLALWVGIGFTANRLMSPAPAGYGLSVGMLFQPAEEQKKIVDQKWPKTPDTLEVPE
jgi:hypothetical protein